MSDSIRSQTPPDSVGKPTANIFIREDFNNVLWDNGYDVLLRQAVACPCKGSSSDSKPSCNNCLGLGWVFVNPIKTRAFVSSINKSTQYKEWSPEFIGTVAITFMNVDKIGFMDEVMLLNNYSLMSENLDIRNTTDIPSKKFIFCSYRPITINSIFVYKSDNEELIKVDPSLYSISTNNPFVVDITYNFLQGFNGKISISYSHKVVYNVIDIPHDMRMTKAYDNNGKREYQEMPVQCIARKSQYELGSPTNYLGTNLLDNSYL